jgi:hypothetical protein
MNANLQKFKELSSLLTIVSLEIKRALEAEMDDAASDRAKQWKMR